MPRLASDKQINSHPPLIRGKGSRLLLGCLGRNASVFEGNINMWRLFVTAASVASGLGMGVDEVRQATETRIGT